MAGTIYAIKDPLTKEIRYVGKTTMEPKTRWSCHLSYRDTKRHSKKTPLYVWMRRLTRDPVFEVMLTGIPEDELRKFELMAMDVAAKHGPGLLNVHRW